MNLSSLALSGDPGIRRPCAGFPGFGPGLSSVCMASMGAMVRRVALRLPATISQGVAT